MERKTLKTPTQSKKNTERKKPHRFGIGNTYSVGKGRPLGSQNFRTAIESISALLASEVIFPGGVKRYLTGKEKLIVKIFARALEGDLKAAEMIISRLEGLPGQQIELTGRGGLPVKILYESVAPKVEPSDSDG